MEAVKRIITDIPNEIDNIWSDNLLKYHCNESKIAYLKIVVKEANEYFKNKSEKYDDLNKYNISCIQAEIEKLEKALELEIMGGRTLIYKYWKETILTELDYFDTYEGQAEYLREKIDEFETDTLDITTDEYEGLRDGLIKLLRSREHKLGIKYEDQTTNNYLKKEKLNNEIDQDTAIEKFKSGCEKRGLKKGKTINNEILFEIAKESGLKVTNYENFKSRDNAYFEAREYASRWGYKRVKGNKVA